MIYEWDEPKAAQNIAKHGVPFEYAARVFVDPYRLDSEDQRREYSEQRRIVLGKVEGRLYAVAYTMRDKIIRLISARKANQREQRKYDETLPT